MINNGFNVQDDQHEDNKVEEESKGDLNPRAKESRLAPYRQEQEDEAISNQNCS